MLVGAYSYTVMVLLIIAVVRKKNIPLETDGAAVTRNVSFFLLLTIKQYSIIMTTSDNNEKKYTAVHCITMLLATLQEVSNN